MTKTLRQRFRVIAFTNRAGSQSWRITGIKRDGTRVRENTTDEDFARARQSELEEEYHSRDEGPADRRATNLTDVQLRLCEAALFKLDSDEDLLPAIDHWLKRDRSAVAESPRLDDAVKKFTEWLDEDPKFTGDRCTLREHSRSGLRLRVGVFGNSVGNLRVNEITPDTIEDFLGKLTKVSTVTKDNYRRAVSRFFSWCIERPRRWTMVNPCREIRVAKAETPPPAVLTLAQSKSLLEAAGPKGLAPYVAVCLFAGLRPFEASRLTWDAVNLKDREIRLEGVQTKTGRARVVAICDTLYAWLTAYDGKEFFPTNWRKKFDAVKEAAGFGGRIVETQGEPEKQLKPWPVDVMRHTAISHYFRKTGSYGQTAEQFGNSEAIIKNHYQGRVSSEDTKQFYALLPKKGGRK